MDFSVHGTVPGYEAAIGKKFTWDVQEMPSFPNGKHVDGMGTAGYAISANSKQRAAAWDFVSFVGSVAGQTALAATGVNMPIRKSMINDTVWRSCRLNNDAFIKAIQYGITPPQLSSNDAALNCGTVYVGLMSTTLSNCLRQDLARRAGGRGLQGSGPDHQRLHRFAGRLNRLASTGRDRGGGNAPPPRSRRASRSQRKDRSWHSQTVSAARRGQAGPAAQSRRLSVRVARGAGAAAAGP